jgi:hypothetical protein
VRQKPLAAVSEYINSEPWTRSTTHKIAGRPLLRLGAAMKPHLGETRAQWALAIFLALTAGYLDGYGLLFLGVFVSFMSGNTTTAISMPPCLPR